MSLPTFVEVIETMLRLHEPGKTRIAFDWFDAERKIGVAFTFPSGRRHAVRVEFTPGWDLLVVEAMRLWIDDHPEVMIAA